MKRPITLGLFIAAIALPAVAVAAPARLFVKGYNLCRAVAPAALTRVTGENYRAERLAGGTCTWTTSDGGSTVVLSVHAASFASLLQGYLKGSQARKIKVPGAKEGVLITLSTPRGSTQQLYALYAGGMAQVNVSSPAQVPAATAVAVMTAIAGR